MGYVVNKLANLPIDENVNFYIFVINGRYIDPLHEIIDQNFTRIAKSIGDHAVIATGTDSENFSTSVARKYLGEGNSDNSFTQMLPALLITDSHPDMLTEKNLRMIVPLREAEPVFGTWPQFFDLLAKFARGESDEFARKFEEKEDFLDAANKIVNLEPGAFGISLNINELIRRWKRRPNEPVVTSAGKAR